MPARPLFEDPVRFPICYVCCTMLCRVYCLNAGLTLLCEVNLGEIDRVQSGQVTMQFERRKDLCRKAVSRSFSIIYGEYEK
jgi:hypothetical protein